MRSTAVARARWGVRGVLCAGLWLATTVHATPISDPSASLTELASAVRASWAKHPAADATEHTLAAARARADAAAQPLYNPDLELAVDDEGDERTSTAGLSWTLDLFGKRDARAALGSAELTQAEAEAALRRSAFAQQWLLAWATHAAARERVRVGEQRLVLVQRFADLAERQLSVGDISPLERDLALLARDEAQAEQATLLGEAAEAAEALRAVGGPPASKDAILPLTPPPAWPDAAPLRLAAIPEARIAAATTTSAERRITIAQRDRRPDPTISINAGRLDMGPTSDNVIGVAISVPLMVRNTYRAELVAAESEALAAESEQRRVVLELEARATRTVDTYDAMRSAWERWAQSPGTDVNKRAELLERLWRAGELSTADYLIQLKQSLDTALAGADLQGRLWRSYVDALYATGRLDAWVGFTPIVSEVSP